MKDSPFDFADLLTPCLPQGDEAVAVAVSGGPDSMALAYMLAHDAQRVVHCLTVDHGLRADAREEAGQVGAWVGGWPHVTHKILVRDVEDNASTKIQEEARQDRYALMADYCAGHNIRYLFVAHHQDDQAETFLFRLAKGSGLDGLGAMRPVYEYSDKLKIMRPFLDIPKAELVRFCQQHEISFVEDPSNDDKRFARVRLRQSYEILEREGLSAKRLAVTAKRLARARAALEAISQQVFDRCVIEGGADYIHLDFDALKTEPEEIRLRVLMNAMESVSGKRDYGPRMERQEDLARRLFADDGFRKASLGGCLVGLDCAKSVVRIEKEAG